MLPQNVDDVPSLATVHLEYNIMTPSAAEAAPPPKGGGQGGVEFT